MANLFNCQAFTAPDRYIGAQSQPIPCAQGDVFTLTSTIRFVSGDPTQMFARVSVEFFNLDLSVFYGFITNIAVLTDNGWHIAVVTGSVPVGAQIAVITTDCEYQPGQAATKFSWEVSDYRVIQNGQAVYAPLQNINPSLTSYAILQEFVYPLYYLSLLSSEYQTAPMLFAFLATLIQPTTDLLACMLQLYQAFNLNTAIGAQLDVIGQIEGASRTLPFQPSTGGVSATLTANVGIGLRAASVSNTIGMVVGNTVFVGLGFPEPVIITAINPGVSFTADFGRLHSAGSPVRAGGVDLNPILTDADYRTLIIATIAQNQWNGQIDSLYQLWAVLFPAGRIIFIDNQNMTATIILAGAFSDIQQAMILNGLIIPRPQAVLYNYSLSPLPVLGYDQSNANVAGWDTGHYT